jgi:hypothetical protein
MGLYQFGIFDAIFNGRGVPPDELLKGRSDPWRKGLLR